MCDQLSEPVIIPESDNIQLTTTKLIIGSVIIGAFVIIVVVLALGIDKCCCKKYLQFQNVESQTTPKELNP